MHTTEVRDKAAGHIPKRGCGCGTGRILVRSSYFMRSLFNTGLGYLDLLTAEPGFSDTDGERYVRHVNDNMKALHYLFENITDMARVEEGVEKMLVEDGDARAFFSLLKDRLRPLGICLEIECQEPVNLRLDGKRMAKTLVNLMVAVAHEGIRSFRISVTESEERMAHLLLTGIADSELPEGVLHTPTRATIEPTLHLEMLKGWIEAMEGFVHEATFSCCVFEVRFSLPGWKAC